VTVVLEVLPPVPADMLALAPEDVVEHCGSHGFFLQLTASDSVVAASEPESASEQLEASAPKTAQQEIRRDARSRVRGRIRAHAAASAPPPKRR
jgi:hypothetical protein